MVRQGIRELTEPPQHVGAGRVQEVVVLPQAGVEGEGVEDGEASIRSL